MVIIIWLIIKIFIKILINHYYDTVPHRKYAIVATLSPCTHPSITQCDPARRAVPMEVLGYHHVVSEVWYNSANTAYTLCNDSSSGEDDSCSNSCSPFSCTSVDDHLDYMDVADLVRAGEGLQIMSNAIIDQLAARATATQQNY